MAYQVLARKWRPKNFDTLVGQAHVVQALCNAFDNARLHHAYLLTGTRGVGKTTIARIMAKALNCETGVTSKPCGVCEACVQIDQGRFVDLLEIDAASNTGIDNIREVLENAQYAPTAGRFKIYIIDEVHMLSKSAFNAMLKTLEEPPPHVKFILATTDPHKVPVTILSRCLQFALKQMTPQLVAQHLAVVLDAETVNYDAESLVLLGHAASGSMRDALSLLDQAIAYGAGKVEVEGIRAMLGVVDQRYIFELLSALKTQDGSTLIALVDTLHLKGLSFEAALSELLHVLHQIAVAQIVPDSVDAGILHYQDILAWARALTPEDVQLYYQIALHGRRDLALATDEYAGFSMTLLRMLAFAPVDDAESHVPSIPVPDQVSKKREEKLPDTSHSNAKADHLLAEPVKVEEAKEPVVIAEQEKPIASSGMKLKDFQLQNWTSLVSSLKGMAMMLAQNSQLISIEGNVLKLHVAHKDKIVAERQYQDKLALALTDYFGEPISLFIEIEAFVEDTPLVLKTRARDQLQIEAETVIQKDHIVQSLMTEFGASLVPNSIKPIE